jgi:hypothetical protein
MVKTFAGLFILIPDLSGAFARVICYFPELYNFSRSQSLIRVHKLCLDLEQENLLEIFWIQYKNQFDFAI